MSLFELLALFLLSAIAVLVGLGDAHLYLLRVERHARDSAHRADEAKRDEARRLEREQRAAERSKRDQKKLERDQKKADDRAAQQTQRDRTREQQREARRLLDLSWNKQRQQDAVDADEARHRERAEDARTRSVAVENLLAELLTAVRRLGPQASSQERAAPSKLPPPPATTVRGGEAAPRLPMLPVPGPLPPPPPTVRRDEPALRAAGLGAKSGDSTRPPPHKPPVPVQKAPEKVDERREASPTIAMAAPATNGRRRAATLAGVQPDPVDAPPPTQGPPTTKPEGSQPSPACKPAPPPPAPRPRSITQQSPRSAPHRDLPIEVPVLEAPGAGERGSWEVMTGCRAVAGELVELTLVPVPADDDSRDEATQVNARTRELLEAIQAGT